MISGVGKDLRCRQDCNRHQRSHEISNRHLGGAEDFGLRGYVRKGLRELGRIRDLDRISIGSKRVKSISNRHLDSGGGLST